LVILGEHFRLGFLQIEYVFYCEFYVILHCGISEKYIL